MIAVRLVLLLANSSPFIVGIVRKKPGDSKINKVKSSMYI
jgi:hypothetical protein